MSLLDQLLEKRGIRDISELSEQERATYEAIKKDLTAEITVGSVIKFLEAEKESLLKEWKEIENKKNMIGKTDLMMHDENLLIKARFINCEKLLALFSGAIAQRKRGEKRAKNLINVKQKK